MARLRELESVTERQIRDQHVVSKVILQGFAAPRRGGKGWKLTPFDVRVGREEKSRGLKGCGRVPDFLLCAAESAERLWMVRSRTVWGRPSRPLVTATCTSRTHTFLPSGTGLPFTWCGACATWR